MFRTAKAFYTAHPCVHAGWMAAGQLQPAGIAALSRVRKKSARVSISPPKIACQFNFCYFKPRIHVISAARNLKFTQFLELKLGTKKYGSPFAYHPAQDQVLHDFEVALYFHAPVVFFSVTALLLIRSLAKKQCTSSKTPLISAAVCRPCRTPIFLQVHDPECRCIWQNCFSV